MKRFFSLLGLIAIAAVGTFLLIPYFVTAETIRESVANRLERLTGREVAISGSASLSVFPSIAVRIGGVSLANAEGMSQEAFVAMDEVNASVRLMPLLSGQVEVERFVLVRPRFNFTVNALGRPNWRLNVTAPKTGGAGSAGTSSPAADPVRIGTFLILDGQIKYRNQRSGAAFDASGINATVAWPSLRAPVTTSGNLVWRGEVLTFKASSDDPIALASGGTSRTAVMIDSSRFTVDVQGQFSTTVDFAVDGRINLRVPSLRALARWFGQELPAGNGLNKLSLASKFVAGGTKFAFSEAALGLDGNTAEGAIVLKLDEPRPQLQATLASATLDLNPYLPTRPPPSAGGPGTPKPPDPGWSAETIDLTALRIVNADLRLSAGNIEARNYVLGSGALTAALADGRLTIQVADLNAYGGRVNGALTIDHTNNTPAMSTNFSAQGVTLLPLLTDMAGFSYLDGKGDISGKLDARGGSARDLVAGLSGKVNLIAAAGAIKGIDLAGAVQALRGQPHEGWLFAVGKDTRFDRLQAEFNFDRGVGDNKDLLLTGPAVEINGAGRIDLPARSLDYRLTAGLVVKPADASQPAQTALALPLIVRGPWDGPEIYPDPVKLNKAAPEVKNIMESVRDAVRNGDGSLLDEAARRGGIEAVLKALRAPKAQ